MAGWLDGWMVGQAASPDVAFVHLTSERGSTNKRTGGGTGHSAPRVGSEIFKCEQI